MSKLNWANLRAWGGSQHNAFEELCCQLAARESAPAGAEYRRIGAPDAGVECIWRNPNQTVRGWQAKFFLQPPTSQEWKQIDKSVSQALQHYDELVSYTVCLPIDRPDGRLEGKCSMMDRWNERVEKWSTEANSLSRKVTFHYWGEHEIVERLARAEHAGRQYFWFSEPVLGSDWFRERFRIAREDAGPRYSPELNVGVEISNVFDALARHPRFIKRIKRQWGAVRRQLERALPSESAVAIAMTFSNDHHYTRGEKHLDDNATTKLSLICSTNPDVHSAVEDIKRLITKARAISEDIGNIFGTLSDSPTKQLPLGELDKKGTDLDNTLADLRGAFNTADSLANQYKLQQISTQSNKKEEQTNSSTRNRRSIFDQYDDDGWRTSFELREFETLLTDASAEVANTPTLLVIGDAGIGKTHLFCDVTERAVTGCEPCVLLLGEHFIVGNPWKQIIEQLHLDCKTPDELLGALSAAGEAANRRALILIDALNEGEGRRLWKDRLAGMLATVARYPWIGIALSIRSSYQSIVIPPAAEKRLTDIEHHGFAEKEMEATQRFFDAHNIERPNVPLLTPEFSNPLFLKLFCRGIRNRGLQRVPPGLEGISAIFSFFLESVQDRLASPDKLDFDSHTPLVYSAVASLTKEMVDTKRQWISRVRANTLLEEVLPTHRGFERSLLRGLLNEGVLSEDLIMTGKDHEMEDAVRFTYERLSDHLIAQLLVDNALKDGLLGRSIASSESPALHETKKDLGAIGSQPSFALNNLFTDINAARYYHGIINALAVYIPEQTSYELWELWPLTKDWGVVQEAFLRSLQWRKPDAIGTTALHMITNHIKERTSVGDRVRDLLVSVAAQPTHPLNADFFDLTLKPGTMADRDVWWSTYAAKQTHDSSPLNRLTDWAWRAGSHPSYTDEAVKLASIVLTWTLACPNRRVRDHATKALVSLLQKRYFVLLNILERFHSIGDLYILERLYAVAYGCALRHSTPDGLDKLARFTFDRVFADGHPPEHLLLRDYARGIIEVAAQQGLLDDIDLRLARPPYKSNPPGRVHTEKYLRKKYYEPSKSNPDGGYYSIWSSLLGGGDFARYIVGTNSHTFDWSSRQLAKSYDLTRRQRHDRFFDSLPDDLRDRWSNIVRTLAINSIDWNIFDIPGNKREIVDSGNLAQYETEEKKSFRELLSPEQRLEFDIVKDWSNEPFEPYRFDLQHALRWLFQRVIQLGWTPERFNWYDRHINYESRMSHRDERIGKKYQWIAFHEFMARVADNFEYVGDRWNHEPAIYHGPWQVNRRDIDPSYLGRGEPQALEEEEYPVWWQPTQYDDWRKVPQDSDWIATTNDLPRIANIISPLAPDTGTQWLWLRGDIGWTEPHPPEEELYERERRSLRYWITGFIVRDKDKDRLIKWAMGRDLQSMRLHETSSTSDVFIKEYPWAPSVTTQFPRLFSNPWTQISDRLPIVVLRPAVIVRWESGGYDGSLDGGVNFYAPTPALLGKESNTKRRDYGTADFLNPSISTYGPDVLLGRASSLQAFLRERKCDIVWLMTGEKTLIGGNIVNRHDEWAGRLEISGIGFNRHGEWTEKRIAFLNRGKGRRKIIRLKN